jgi:hypothetical protein
LSRVIKGTFLTLILLLNGFTLARAAYPPDFDARYKIKKGIFSVAKSNITLSRQANGSLLYRSETIPLGIISLFRNDLITETSTMEKHQDDYRPTRFRYIHKGSKKNRDIDITFDWEQHMASNHIAGKKWQHSIPDDAVDTFSMQVRLMHDMHSGKKKLDYSIISKNELKTYHFKIIGNETVEVSAGKFKTIKLVRKRKDSSRTTYMWLAPELHYLPVRIRHVEKDSSKFDMELEQLRGKITGGKSIPADAEWD